MKKFYSFLLFMVFWGPPKFGFERDPLAVRDNPLMLNPIQTLKVGLWILTGIVVVLLFLNAVVFRKKKFRFNPETRFFLGFILIAILTSYVSLNKLYTWFSIYQLLVFFGFVYFLAFSRILSFEEIFNILMTVFVVNVLIIMGAFLIKPELVSIKTSVFGVRITGAPLIPDYGGSGLFAFTFLLLKKRMTNSKLTGMDTFLLVLSLVYVLLSRTRSGILLLILVVLLYLYYFKNLRAIYIYLFIMITLVVNFLNVEGDIFTFLVRETRSLSTLSNRLNMWSAALGLFEQRPFTGVGYLGFRSYYDILGFGDSHNSYIEILVGTGIMGFLLYVMSLVLLLRRYIKNLRINEFYPMLAFFSLVILLILSFAATAIAVPGMTYFLLITILIYSLTLIKRANGYLTDTTGKAVPTILRSY
ncbi:MAG: O-antigen ligase family protein [Calditrichaceae bacterium]|nr:O-antigen ligase family protein [Calditrichia bacterium]NUQ42880.1 O-antigen ligase family protein [Calditrichaceae bacterium]